MISLKKFLTSFILILVAVSTSFAQSANQVEMADAWHANGKIYVVVTVLAIIFIGVIVFLMNIDRKVSRLEKEIRKSGDEVTR